MARVKRDQSKTKVRKAPENLNHMAIISDYAEGSLTVPEIAKKYQTTESNVGLMVTRFWRSLTNMKESRALQAMGGNSTTDHFDGKQSLTELQGTHLINQGFLDLLSDPQVQLLTDAEATYAWVLVHTGDMREALKLAGLDIGLHKEKPEKPPAGVNTRETRFSYDRALALRSAYLNSKPNVLAYIKELRETRLIDSDISKTKVQSELIDQLEQMKASNDPHRHRTQILRTIELLGKTIGAFTENISITQVDPSDALDKLIEMAQEASVTELPRAATKEITQ